MAEEGAGETLSVEGKSAYARSHARLHCDDYQWAVYRLFWFDRFGQYRMPIKYRAELSQGLLERVGIRVASREH